MDLMIADGNKDITGQVGMTLAAIAYAKGGDIPNILADTTLATKGRWQMQWLGTDDANQVFIAKNRESGQFAVSIRGSVIDPFTEAFWLNWFEQDLDAFDMKQWPYGGTTSGAKIAYGTLKGLQHLIDLKNEEGRNIVDFLKANLKPGKSLLTAVVGHSLGGALASVFAPYLHQQFSPEQKVLDFWPVTFAGPTAGNETYASWLENQFAASASRYFNDIDIVPRSWSDLEWIVNSFPNGGQKLPFVLSGLVIIIKDVLKKLHDHYAQPGPGMQLKGSIIKHDSWFAEAGHQHSSANYLALVGAPPIPQSKT